MCSATPPVCSPEPFRGATRQPAGAEPVRQQADVLGGQAAEGEP